MAAAVTLTLDVGTAPTPKPLGGRSMSATPMSMMILIGGGVLLLLAVVAVVVVALAASQRRRDE